MIRGKCFNVMTFCMLAFCFAEGAEAEIRPLVDRPQSRPAASNCYEFVLQALSETNAITVASLIQDRNFYVPWVQYGLYAGWLDDFPRPDNQHVVNSLLVLVAADIRHGHDFSATLWFRRQDRLARMLLLAICLVPLDSSQDCFVGRFQKWNLLFNSDERRFRMEELLWVLSHRQEIKDKVRVLLRAVWRQQEGPAARGSPVNMSQ